MRRRSHLTPTTASRLGPWEPSTLEERLDRMESLAAIGQLAARYAVALDSRNIDDLVSLFTPDVRVGREHAGREALAAWFTDTFRSFQASVHLVGNHVVEFDDADHARGIVYCHDELEYRDRAEWHWGHLQYWDTYVRVEGEWCFERRRFHRLYMVDAAERPRLARDEHGDGADQPLTTHYLPDAHPTWHQFWARTEAAASGPDRPAD